jgi:hypothetical protein
MNKKTKVKLAPNFKKTVDALKKTPEYWIETIKFGISVFFLKLFRRIK